MFEEYDYFINNVDIVYFFDYNKCLTDKYYDYNMYIYEKYYILLRDLNNKIDKTGLLEHLVLNSLNIEKLQDERLALVYIKSKFPHISCIY
jgi:hypothetical protein